MTNLKTTHGSTDLRLFGLFASAIVHPFNNKLFACFLTTGAPCAVSHASLSLFISLSPTPKVTGLERLWLSRESAPRILVLHCSLHRSKVHVSLF